MDTNQTSSDAKVSEESISLVRTQPNANVTDPFTSMG